MNLSAGWTELNGALKSMRQQWEDVKAHWNDGVAHSFEEDRWTPLEDQVVATLRAIDRLAPLLTKALHECS